MERKYFVPASWAEYDKLHREWKQRPREEREERLGQFILNRYATDNQLPDDALFYADEFNAVKILARRLREKTDSTGSP